MEDNTTALTSRSESLQHTAKMRIHILLALTLLTIHPGCSRQPKRIIHLVNAPFVSRRDFAAELSTQSAEPISETEIDERYASFLNDLEILQNEQEAILRSLIRKYGVRSVFVDSEINQVLEYYQDVYSNPQEMDLHRATRLMDESDDPETKAKLRIIVDEIQLELFAIGAAGRLVVDNELHEIKSLQEDAKLIATGAPEGFVLQFAERANDEAREHEMVRRLVASGTFTVIILTGSRDLKDKISEACSGCRYERITPEGYARASAHLKKPSVP